VSPFDNAKCKKMVSEFWEKAESQEIVNRQKIIQGFILMGYNGPAIWRACPASAGQKP
jgi:hypothetical protein